MRLEICMVWHWTYQMRILWLNNVERRSSNGFNNKNVEGMLSKGLLEIKLPSATSNRVQQPGWSNSSTYSTCTLTLLNWTIRRMLDEILRLFDHVLKRPTFHYLTMSTFIYSFVCLFCFVFQQAPAAFGLSTFLLLEVSETLLWLCVCVCMCDVYGYWKPPSCLVKLPVSCFLLQEYLVSTKFVIYFLSSWSAHYNLQANINK